MEELPDRAKAGRSDLDGRVQRVSAGECRLYQAIRPMTAGSHNLNLVGRGVDRQCGYGGGVAQTSLRGCNSRLGSIEVRAAGADSHLLLRGGIKLNGGRGRSSRQTERVVPGRTGSLIKNAYNKCSPLPRSLGPFPFSLFLLPHLLLLHAPYVSTTDCLYPPLSPCCRPRWHRRRPLLDILLPLDRCRRLHYRRRGQPCPQRPSRRPSGASSKDNTPDMEVRDPPPKVGQSLATLS